MSPDVMLELIQDAYQRGWDAALTFASYHPDSRPVAPSPSAGESGVHGMDGVVARGGPSRPWVMHLPVKCDVEPHECRNSDHLVIRQIADANDQGAGEQWPRGTRDEAGNETSEQPQAIRADALEAQRGRFR